VSLRKKSCLWAQATHQTDKAPARTPEHRLDAAMTHVLKTSLLLGSQWASLLRKWLAIGSEAIHHSRVVAHSNRLTLSTATTTCRTTKWPT